MILDQCPHCGTRHVNTVHQAECHDAPHNEVWRVVLCGNPACKRLTLFLLGRDNSKRFQYPPGQYDLINDPAISDEVRAEFREAGTALAIGCYLSSMTMSRRVLQRCLKQQGFQQKTLAQQIDAAKADGTIPKRYHQLADEIRQYGNMGAHPDDDNAALVNQQNAEHLLAFVEILIHEFYELPARAAALSKQRA